HKQVLKINSDDPGAHWNMSHALLDMGRWAEGFREYEYRMKHAGPSLYPELQYPTWDGKADLNGKAIFIQAEQGVGDRILFSRYLPWLKKKYPKCKIYFLCPERLQALF